MTEINTPVEFVQTCEYGIAVVDASEYQNRSGSEGIKTRHIVVYQERPTLTDMLNLKAELDADTGEFEITEPYELMVLTPDDVVSFKQHLTDISDDDLMGLG